jgi:hypothetical protein
VGIIVFTLLPLYFQEAFEWVNKLVNPFEDLLRDKEALKRLQAAVGKYVVW